MTKQEADKQLAEEDEIVFEELPPISEEELKLAVAAEAKAVAKANNPEVPTVGTPITATKGRVMGVNITIPVGTRLNITFLGDRINYPSELVGMSGYEYLVVKMPTVPGLRTRLVPDAGFSVRYAYKGAIYTFMSTVIALITKPDFLVFCSFPTSVELVEFRKHQRVSCVLPAKFQTQIAQAHCLLLDLSPNGCKIALELTQNKDLRELVNGDVATLNFQLFSIETALELKSTICTIELEVTRMYVGLRFEEMTPSQTRELKFFLAAASMLLPNGRHG